jgi:hypothetical protein
LPSRTMISFLWKSTSFTRSVMASSSPQAGAVQQSADEKRRPLEVRKDDSNLVASEHDRQAM